VVQLQAARLGVVTGKGLAELIREQFGVRWTTLAMLVLLLANGTVTIAEIAGIAAAGELFGIPRLVAVPVAGAAIWFLVVRSSYSVAEKIFVALAAVLLSYVAAAFLAHPRWGEVFRSTLVPHLSADGKYLTTLVAILGTTITPYLYFWQSSQEVEEEVSMGRKTLKERKGATQKELNVARADTLAGMIFCNLVFYFVILAAATTLHATGKTDVQSATDAAKALEPVAGAAAKYLFAAGLIGAGFLAVPVLTGASAYAVAETFGWNYGLDTKPHEAKQFYAIIATSTLVGMLINFLGINPIKALFWTAVINGVVAPPLLVVILLVANNKRVMGERTNGRGANAVGWLTAALMFAAAVGMFLTWNS
jgi:Mn2+/Fe2+ NRAMP family transporter